MSRNVISLTGLCLVVFATVSLAQMPVGDPHLGYAYPAGAQAGTQLEVTLGGQYLDNAIEAIVSGEGVSASVVSHKKPLSMQQVNRLRNKLQEAMEKLREQGPPARGPRFMGYQQMVARAAAEAGVSQQELNALREFRERRQDPKRQLNPQISEELKVQFTVTADATPGMRDLRILTPRGLTNPIRFLVGRLPEQLESEPNDQPPDGDVVVELPVILNGQVMPGDVDHFRFAAKAGQKITVAAQARELIPYLADAVPGWFQATLTLYDAQGKEVAYADDFRFQPDPVLFFEIPVDGEYCLEIKDAVYRGREDFVYRIAVGELPYVTHVFPLGCSAGRSAEVELHGWNLTQTSHTIAAETLEPGTHHLATGSSYQTAATLPIAIDDDDESLEAEPNDDPDHAQQVTLPSIVNGRIDEVGDWDMFSFTGRAGQRLVAEVYARRLNSPVDSVLMLADADGEQLAVNDDHEDKAAGLTTHHADSRLEAVLPADGVYRLCLAEAQNKGGPEYAYRLHLGSPQPDFQLRVTPASITARAGALVPVTVHALRHDGFDGDILLRLKGALAGFSLSGARIPAGEDHVCLTLAVPAFPRPEPIPLQLEGVAELDGRTMRRTATPADDQMQAFIYRHLVPCEQWLVAVQGRSRTRVPQRLFADKPVSLPAGDTQSVHFFLQNTPADLGQIRFELSDAPEGISIGGATRLQHGIALRVNVDSEKAVVGSQGNLIVQIILERTFSGPEGTNRKITRQIPLGVLPAIPYEIVEGSS